MSDKPEDAKPRWRVLRLNQTDPQHVVAELESADQAGYLPSGHLGQPAIPLPNGDLLLIFEAAPAEWPAC